MMIDERCRYVRVRQDRALVCCLSAGFGDLVGDWFGRNKSGERRVLNRYTSILQHSRPGAMLFKLIQSC